MKTYTEGQLDFDHKIKYKGSSLIPSKSTKRGEKVVPSKFEPRRIKDPRALLSDEEVIWCRQNIKTVKLTDMALKYMVSYAVIVKAVKGITFKHLDRLAKPQR